MFENIRLYKSGREIKNAISARINLSELTKDKELSPEIITVLKIMERNLVDNYRYELTIGDAILLNI